MILNELAYNAIVNLGFKDMPFELYQEWVQSVENEKQKRNIKIKK
ncbi:MAG: hypothetical protein ACOCWM_05405 [Cyclobacteriaceae bacterium]